MKIKIIPVILLATLLLAGCAGKPPVWETDYDTALASAQKKNKNMLIFFSGIEWDGISQQLKNEIFDTPKFGGAAQRNYILLNIDIPANAETLSQEEMEKKSMAIERYAISGTPSVILANKEGAGFGTIPYDDTVKISSDYIKNLNEQTKSEKKRNALRKKIISTTKGPEKVKLIDELFEATSMEFKDNLMDLISQVPDLDPQNETGLLGKYELQLIYPQAMAMYAMGDPVSGAQLFIDFGDSGNGRPEDNQQAYYMAAYLNASIGTELEIVLGLLQKAYDAAPSSESAPAIQQTIEQLKSIPAEGATGGQ